MFTEEQEAQIREIVRQEIEASHSRKNATTVLNGGKTFDQQVSAYLQSAENSSPKVASNSKPVFPIDWLRFKTSNPFAYLKDEELVKLYELQPKYIFLSTPGCGVFHKMTKEERLHALAVEEATRMVNDFWDLILQEYFRRFSPERREDLTAP